MFVEVAVPGREGHDHETETGKGSVRSPLVVVVATAHVAENENTERGVVTENEIGTTSPRADTEKGTEIGSTGDIKYALYKGNV